MSLLERTQRHSELNVFKRYRRITLENLQAFLVALLTRFKEKDGQALVEYALILALVAIVVIVALHFLGHSVNNTITNIGQTVNKAG